MTFMRCDGKQWNRSDITYGIFAPVLSRTACGAIIPIIAKVFMWYGVAYNKKPNFYNFGIVAGKES